MRYIITLSNGDTFASDFEAGHPIAGGSPATIICRAVREAWVAGSARPPVKAWEEQGPPHQRYVNPAHVVTVLDNDCG